MSAEPAALAASAALPFKAATDTTLPGGSQWGLAVVLCCLALAAALWLLRRHGAASGTNWRRGRGAMVEVLETRLVAPQTQLVVARYGERQLLLSVGPAGTQCLRDDAVVPEGVA
jgi:flagellar biogenesis protein FliO